MRLHRTPMVPLLLGIAAAACSDAIAPSSASTGDAAGRARASAAVVGDTFRLHPSVRRAGLERDPVTWEIADSSVAMVEDGLVVPIAEGRTTITARSSATGATSDYSLSVRWGTVRPNGVDLKPKTATAKVGDTLRFYARVSFTNGTSVTVHTMPTWTVSDRDLASIAAGRFVAKRPGTVKVHATVGTVRDSAVVTVGGTAAPTPPRPGEPAPPPAPSPGPAPTSVNGHIVAPNGTSSGDGTAAKPWDLRTVLAHPSKVKPGDTIYVRGGTYKGLFTSRLAGTSGAPIVLRAMPRERVTLDANGADGAILTINGSHAIYWGLEVVDSKRSPRAKGAKGVELHGPGTKLVNSVVHDVAGVGVGLWLPATNAEVYGSLVYNTGFQKGTSGTGHSIYSQNRSGVKRIVDNFVFSGYSYALHMYGSSTSALVGYHIEGNTIFNSGALSSKQATDNVYFGGGATADDITIRRNVILRSPGKGGVMIRLGNFNAVWHGSVELTDNILTGGSYSLVMGSWRRATVQRNTLNSATLAYINPRDLKVVGGYSWRDNAHVASASSRGWVLNDVGYTWSDWKARTKLGASDRLTSRPATPTVIVRANQYERGRANITVVNWTGAGSASADVSAILKRGDAYELRDAQDYYGAPVATGVYQGGSLTLPLAPRAPAAPIGGTVSRAPTTTDHLAAFVLQLR